MSRSRKDGLCPPSTPDEKVSALMAATVSEKKRTGNGANGRETMQIENKKENIQGKRPWRDDKE